MSARAVGRLAQARQIVGTSEPNVLSAVASALRQHSLELVHREFFAFTWHGGASSASGRCVARVRVSNLELPRLRHACRLLRSSERVARLAHGLPKRASPGFESSCSSRSDAQLCAAPDVEPRRAGSECVTLARAVAAAERQTLCVRARCRVRQRHWNEADRTFWPESRGLRRMVRIRVVAFARCPGFVVNHRGEQSRAFTTLQKL